MNKSGEILDNIVLIGMMGSGKTTVGKALAKKFGCVFLDLDELIIEKSGATIPEIFTTKGEAGFREIEASTLKNLNCKNTVISTGGGIIEREENISLMKTLGEVFYLDAPIKTLYDRIQGDSNRPLLKSEKEFEEILKRREPIYRRAGYKIDATQSVDEIVKEIYEHSCRNAK